MVIIYTNDENPGKGARDLAMLFMTICVPFKLTTALDPSWSLSVKDEYPRGFVDASWWLVRTLPPMPLADIAPAAAPPIAPFDK